MKTTRKLFLAFGLFISLIIIYSSCQKDIDLPDGQQSLKIFMTDNPVPFDAVFVDIQRVEVQVIPDSCRSRDDDDDDDDGDNDNHDGDDDDEDEDDDEDGRGNHDGDDDEEHCFVWDTLHIRPGVYNLLDFSNGADTLLASGYTPAGRIKKIRITLGDNNSVVIDSVSYPLELYRNRHHVIINVHHDDVIEISPGNFHLFLDFDACKSIIRIDNNRFVLRPRLRLFVPGRTATIEGRVIPDAARAVVAAYANGDTLVAIPEHDDGEFKIRGLRGNSADVFINATANGYRDTTITGVPLTPGRETDIGTIRLRQ